MNENMPATENTSVLTSVSSSNTDDTVDLIDIDDDECEVTSSSVIVSNYSINPQHPESKLAQNRRKITKFSEDGSSKECSGSTDDSICILYENIQPSPDIVVVNEVIIGDNDENESANNDLYSIPIPPVIMGSYAESPITMFQQIPPLFPELSNEMTSSSQPIDYSFDSIRAHQHSSLPSCKYARPHEPVSVPPYPVPLQGSPLSTTRVPLNLKTVSNNVPNLSSSQEKSNIVIPVPKIQCGICLDGPDEIAASNKNFTSTNCGHIFCNECIKISMKNAAKCPKCRKKITSRQIHPLYL